MKTREECEEERGMESRRERQGDLLPVGVATGALEYGAFLRFAF